MSQSKKSQFKSKLKYHKKRVKFYDKKLDKLKGKKIGFIHYD